MLQLNNIVKTYVTGNLRQDALKGVSIAFRENEFVSILGQSGSGKTTLLNIIGGLDRYTSGDLLINGVSTKAYRDSDWDYYRNDSIGFVFQSYNLIPHQSVLANVELALTLAGVSKKERRERAIAVLQKVGLEEHIHKKPNQMSGGQMQRVAIARALINDPDILLADEPTGALDSETSLQIMELLKDIAREKLVIMVTHNPELAQKYSTRIVQLLDGEIVSDTDPCPLSQKAAASKPKKKISMSFFTALSLSLNNLRTKKGRTILTAFAGSIGIIGIALILALSTGINNYISQVQEETLSSYPLTIQAESTDMTSLMTSFMGVKREDEASAASRDPDRVYASTVMYDMMDAMLNAETQTNNLQDFKEYIDNGGGELKELATVHYSYDFDFRVFTQDENGDILQCDVLSLMQGALAAMYGGDYSSYFDSMGAMYSAMDVWTELLPGDSQLVSPQITGQYELLYGGWPEKDNQVMLFVDGNNEISDLMLYALGLMPQAEMEEAMASMAKGETLPLGEEMSWTYAELCQRNYKLILPAECYQLDNEGNYTDLSSTEAGLDFLYHSSEIGIPLEVCGVARSKGGNGGMLTGSIGYTSALTHRAIETSAATKILSAQLADPDTDAISGLPFPKEDDLEPTDQEKADSIKEYLSTASAGEKAAIYIDVASRPSQAYVDQVVAQQMEGMTRETIEQMILQQSAGEMGVSEDTLRSYIAEMDDATLFARVEEAMSQSVREQYSAAAAQKLSSLSSDQLAAAMTQILTLGVAEDPAAVEDGVRPGMGAEPSGTLTAFTLEQYLYLYDAYMPPTRSASTYEDNLDLLGYIRLDSPSAISLYATTFAQKDEIADRITAYNQTAAEEDQITYTDYVAMLMSSITAIISGISYLLIAFVSISLVVSSIMIGIITNISVLERTKEIGILRAVGASRRDVSRVFNAETFTVGLAAGGLGILVSVLATIPINAIIHQLTDLNDLAAVLPVGAAAILVCISVALTMIAGLIPARSAAKKDPVVALRTE